MTCLYTSVPCRYLSHQHTETDALFGKHSVHEAVVCQVRTDNQLIRVDAAVNSGNTLASWAELTDPATSIQLLDNAHDAYKIALQQEEDAAVSFAVMHQRCSA